MELPTPTTEIEQISTYNGTLIEQAKAITIATADDVDAASKLGFQINATLKRIEEKRTGFTKPANDWLKMINQSFKDVSAPLTEAKNTLANGIAVWQRTERERIIKEEARRNAIAKAAEEKRRVKEPETYRPAEDIALARPSTNIGNSSVSKVWTFEVVDFAQVPDEYKEIVSPRVNEQIRNGAREIAGLRIYQTERVSFK